MIKNVPSCLDVTICFAITTTGVGLQPILQMITRFHYGPYMIIIELFHGSLHKSIVCKNTQLCQQWILQEKNKNCDRERMRTKKIISVPREYVKAIKVRGLTIANVQMQQPKLTANRYCPLWPVTYRHLPRGFKTRILERGFHTLIRNASFSSPTNVGPNNPPPRGFRVLTGTPP